MTTITTNPVTQQVAAPVTKRSITAEIYKCMVNEGKHTRKDIIAEFVDAGCTQQGASTYYSNFKSGTWKVEGVTGSIAATRGTVGAVATSAEQTDLDLMIHYSKFAMFLMTKGEADQDTAAQALSIQPEETVEAE